MDLKGRAVRARRQDVFELLLGRGSLSRSGYEAVRRLQEDIAVLHRTLAGVSEFTPRVDRSRHPEGLTVARQRAGERIDAVLALAGPLTGGVIRALCEADVALGRPADWRTVVATFAGERLPDAQGAILRFACENLAGAYACLDRRVR